MDVSHFLMQNREARRDLFWRSLGLDVDTSMHLIVNTRITVLDLTKTKSTLLRLVNFYHKVTLVYGA